MESLASVTYFGETFGSQESDCLIIHQQRKKGLINTFTPEKATKKKKKMVVWSSKIFNAYQLQNSSHIIDFTGQIYDSANVPLV